MKDQMVQLLEFLSRIVYERLTSDIFTSTVNSFSNCCVLATVFKIALGTTYLAHAKFFHLEVTFSWMTGVKHLAWESPLMTNLRLHIPPEKVTSHGQLCQSISQVRFFKTLLSALQKTSPLTHNFVKVSESLNILLPIP